MSVSRQQGGRAIPHLVSADEVAELAAASEVRIVDVRWRLGSPGAGRALFEDGHIPSAVFADVDGDLASAPGAGGRHPLPSPPAFAALMRRLGIGEATRVVAYDDQGGAIASRLWFLLRYFGHETCAVLDGGLAAFAATGRPLERGDGATFSATSPFVAEPRPELIVDRQSLVARLGSPSLRLFDARAPERFRGDSEPIDPKPGHIPSAVNAPFTANLEAGRFSPRATLEGRYRWLGALSSQPHETVVYCGSGVTACHDLLALALCGDEAARLYPGSWSEWSRVEGASVARGA